MSKKKKVVKKDAGFNKEYSVYLGRCYGKLEIGIVESGSIYIQLTDENVEDLPTVILGGVTVSELRNVHKLVTAVLKDLKVRI